MQNEEINKIAVENGIFGPFKQMRDIDGPGIGNAAIVEREERPKEGGIYVYLYGYKYPYKGIPYDSTVQSFRVTKKIFLFALHSFNNKITMGAIGLVLILPKFISRKIIESTVNFIYSLVEWLIVNDLMKPERYCNCVRELYRTFDVLIKKEKEPVIKKALTLLRDVFCLFIEQDSAYKFRFQDIMAEVNVDKIRNENEMKEEIRRIIGILKQRELFPVFAEHKWATIEKVLYPSLIIGSIRKLIYDFVKEVDFNKLKPDRGDWYYDTLRLDYDFGGKRLEERIRERRWMDRENWDKYNFEALAISFLQEYRKYKKPMGVVKNEQNHIAGGS